MNLPERKNLQIGKLGTYTFEKGIYFYVGSAKGGFAKRVTRYFKKIKSKKWHIDYLLSAAKVIGVFLFDKYTDEETLSKSMSLMYKMPVPKFGATDSRFFSHLFKKESPWGKGAI